MLRQAIREAVLLVVASVVLGFSYTAVTKRGFFADQSIPRAVPGAPAPSAIPFEEARALFDAGTALFIDSRHEFDYKLGHIRGAMNIPLKDFDKKQSALSSVPTSRTLVIYCDGAECNSSIELAAKLSALGYTNVKFFFGGWQEWKNNNLPTVTTP